MTTNDATRAAMVKDLARGASDLVQGSPYDLSTPQQQEARQKEVEHHLMPVIDRLLAEERKKALKKNGPIQWTPEWQFGFEAGRARAVTELDADMTLAYMKGWQDGQDAMRKSVDAAVDSASREEGSDE